MPLVELRNIDKRFGAVTALKDVSIDIGEGEIHGLLGENGAGKSTLIKILTGAHRPDGGEIRIEGRSYPYLSVKEAEAFGIAAVYQDLKLAPGISVAENIVLGRYPCAGGVWVNRRRARELARQALDMVGARVDPDVTLGELKAADQELVAIAKALSRNARLLILDEPTALLAEDDVQRLFQVLRDLSRRGVSILYISHRLEEIFALCDRATVLRDGEKVWTRPIAGLSSDDLVEAIAGRLATEGSHWEPGEIGEEVLRAEGLTKPPYYRDIRLAVRRGEVVGLFGLVGSGKSELLKGMFGALPPDAGALWLDGRLHRPVSPRHSIRSGMGLVPEDRSAEGFLPRLPLYVNANIASYRLISRRGLVWPALERGRARRLFEGFNVKYNSLDQVIESLSGGNQQKVVVAKWIGTQAKVLLLDEPTAGIDVGARRDVFRITRGLAGEGKAILYCSSYLPEVMEVSDRILVMSRGRITGEFPRGPRFDEMAIMKAAYQ